MRTKLSIFLLSALLITLFSSVCYGQKIDTSSESAYKSSIADVYSKLSSDRQLEFEAFFYCVLDEGKTLVNVNKLKGITELQEYYPIVEALEEEGAIKLNGQTADDIIVQGKSLLVSKLKAKIEDTDTDAQRDRLKAQLAIIEKKALTKEDLEAFSNLK